jgi:hypothetical protein
MFLCLLTIGTRKGIRYPLLGLGYTQILESMLAEIFCGVSRTEWLFIVRAGSPRLYAR